MSYSQQLETIRSQALTLIAEITSSPKPNYSIDGQSVSWADYLAKLQQQVDWCNAQMNAAEPYEVHTQGYT